jgi:hypothetical protein
MKTQYFAILEKIQENQQAINKINAEKQSIDLRLQQIEQLKHEIKIQLKVRTKSELLNFVDDTDKLNLEITELQNRMTELNENLQLENEVIPLLNVERVRIQGLYLETVTAKDKQIVSEYNDKLCLSAQILLNAINELPQIIEKTNTPIRSYWRFAVTEFEKMLKNLADENNYSYSIAISMKDRPEIFAKILKEFNQKKESK